MFGKSGQAEDAEGSLERNTGLRLLRQLHWLV